jgi:hypothetical protein
MVKCYGPALSLDASGTIAKTVTYSKWKGRNYARTRVVPANPRSASQTGMRAMFRFLTQAWAAILTASQATWETRAAAKAVSPFNEFLSYNQLRWRDFKAPTSLYPEAATDTPSVAGVLSATAGERTIQVQQLITTANDGWAVLFFRSPTGTFATAWDKLVGVKLIDGTDPVILVDGPLDPGTYYYDTRLITLDGQLSAETGEQSAVLS